MFGVTSPAVPATSGWTVTHRAVAATVADAVGIGVPRHWSPGTPEAAALVDRVDWSRFTGLVTGHAVAPLVRRSTWLAALGVPSAVDSRLHVLARRGVSANLRNLAALGEIVPAADRAGVDLVVLDGLALAAWAYGDPLARHSAHLRLLVDHRSLGAVSAVLGGLGFEVIGPSDALRADAPVGDAELTFVRGATFVDLRWRLFANAALLPLDLADPRHRLRVDVGGLTVTTMARELTWWYLATYGTNQRWSSLRWLADVPAVLGACPGLLEPAALDRTAAVGADRCVATALRLAADVLGLALPAEVSGWVDDRPGSERLAHQSRRYLAATVAPANGRAPVRLVERASFTLAMRRDARYRRAMIRLMVVQGAHDRLVPLAERWGHRADSGLWRGLRAARRRCRAGRDERLRTSG